MMAVLDLFDDGSDFAAKFLGPPHAEDFADTVGRQTPQADFAAALEDLWMGKWRLKMKLRQYSICAIE
jgi:hypothetical protein